MAGRWRLTNRSDQHTASGAVLCRLALVRGGWAVVSRRCVVDLLRQPTSTVGDATMTITGRAYCPRCGARLRRGQPEGAHCDPCHRAGPDPTQDLPPDFFLHNHTLRTALADYDFATVFLGVRAETSWSQQRLGGLVGLDQGQISSIERRTSRLWNVRLVAGIAHGLRIPGALLNFPDFGATVSTTGVARRKDVSWVDRRDFGQHIAALLLSAAAATGLDTDRLLALLPHAEPTGTRRLGTADVEIIEQLTAAFRRQDWRYGSGLAGDAAAAQVRSVLPLLDAQVSPELRPRLLIAAADLALQAAWMSFDQGRHDTARRLWMIGLDLARDADHPQATDLTVHLLVDMANQAEHLGRPDEALHLLRIGHSVAAGSKHPVSPAETTCLTAVLGWAHAARRDTAGCERALGQATEQFSTIDSAQPAPWTGNINEAFLAARQGHAHYALALIDRDPRAADRAVPLLRRAVNQYGPAYASSAALYLPEVAGAHALAGDADTAVTAGHQAIDAVTAVSSPRAYDRLRTLHTVLEPLDTSPGVAELRGRLVATAA